MDKSKIIVSLNVRIEVEENCYGLKYETSTINALIVNRLLSLESDGIFIKSLTVDKIPPCSPPMKPTEDDDRRSRLVAAVA